MANALTTQIIIDGPRNAVVKVVGILDTSDISSTAIVDPASFTPTPTAFRVDNLQYSVEDGITVRLWWDASTDVIMATLNGAYRFKNRRFGGFTNNAGAGVTGKIMLSTEGYAAGTQAFTLSLEMTKQGI